MTVTTPTGTAEVYRSPFNISGIGDPDASVPDLGSHDPAFIQHLLGPRPIPNNKRCDPNGH